MNTDNHECLGSELRKNSLRFCVELPNYDMVVLKNNIKS
jgi:hypothetical protein